MHLQGSPAYYATHESPGTRLDEQNAHSCQKLSRAAGSGGNDGSGVLAELFVRESGGS